MFNYKFEPVEVFAYGKIVLAGEWSVLELGNSCIVVGVTRGVRAKIVPFDVFQLVIQAIDLVVDFSVDKKGQIYSCNFITEINESQKKYVRHVQQAISVVFQYFYEQKKEILPCQISIESEISPSVDGLSGKIGLGSSAAAVVAVVKGLLRFSGVFGECDETINSFGQSLVFKLSYIAHFLVQGCLGSGFDVAAAVYGGALLYSRVDPRWLQKRIDQEKKGIITFTTIVWQEWPYLSIVPVALPPEMKINVGFSGEGVSTKVLIEKMAQFKERNRKVYKVIVENLEGLVKALSQCLFLYDQDKKLYAERILLFIEANRFCLASLGALARINLETPDLKKMCDLAVAAGGRAKFSGAGGGDCGISVCFDDGVNQEILRAWQESGVRLVYQN